METVMIPNAFPAAIPAYAQQGGSWRPTASSVLRAYPMTRPAAQHWRPAPIQLGQVQTPSAAASIAKGADVLFSLLTAVGAMTVGIAAMTVGVGGNPRAVPPTGASGTWKWIGGITAALGALMILSNVSKISKASEMVPQIVSVPANQ